MCIIVMFIYINVEWMDEQVNARIFMVQIVCHCLPFDVIIMGCFALTRRRRLYKYNIRILCCAQSPTI